MCMYMHMCVYTYIFIYTHTYIYIYKTWAASRPTGDRPLSSSIHGKRRSWESNADSAKRPAAPPYPIFSIARLDRFRRPDEQIFWQVPVKHPVISTFAPASARRRHIYPSIYLSIYLYIYLSIYLSIYLPRRHVEAVRRAVRHRPHSRRPKHKINKSITNIQT